MGSLGDRIGRRRLLLSGAAAFGAASMLAAYAQSAEMLIAARALLGVGGATLMPSTLALIRTMFHDAGQRAHRDRDLDGGAHRRRGGRPGDERAAARTLLVGLGLPGEHSRRWRCCSCSRRCSCPSPRTPEPAGSTCSAPCCRSPPRSRSVYGIKELAEDGHRPLPVAAIAAGLLVAVLFLRRQARPVPDDRPGPAAAARFGGSLLVGLPAMFAMMGSPSRPLSSCSPCSA